MKTLKEIIARLAELAVEVRDAVDVETVDALGIEKKELLERKAELEELEKRKQGALDLEEGKVGFKVVDKTKEERNKPEIKGAESIEYKSAFLKSLLGEKMTIEERTLFTHTTANTEVVMPTELQNMIYSTMEEAHPLLADVQVLRTGAVISIVKHTAIVAGDAAVVLEGVANDDEENTFVNVTLSGKDFSKHVDFSYRLGKMAIPAFEQYLVKEIADRIGAAMTRDIVAQIKLDLVAGNKFAAVLPGTLAKADVLKGLGLLKSTGRVNVYANNATFYGSIANMTGMEGLLGFIPNYQDAISGQLFGKGIKEEDALIAGEVLILDPAQFVYNVVQDIMLEKDNDIKKHVHTISGFAIAEGTLTNDKAGALITVGVAA